MNTKKIAKAGIISALYIVLSVLTFPIASGTVQLRLSEGLCLLPLLFSESIFGVFVGCLLVNIITGCVVYDVFLGSLITLISAYLTFLIGKIIKTEKLKIAIGGIFPVLLNAFFLPILWIYITGIDSLYWITALSIFISQILSVYIIGIPIYLIVKKISEKYSKK